MMPFLPWLLVGIARKVFEEVKLEVKKRETLEVVQNHNCTDANFDRLGLHANREPQAKEKIPVIL